MRTVELLELARTTDLSDPKSLDAGFAAEDDALADLLMTDELRAGLYAFDLVKPPREAPGRGPRQVVGAQDLRCRHRRSRLMASHLAMLFVKQLKVPVILTDIDQERIDKGVGYVHGEIDNCSPRAVCRRTAPTASRRS